MLKNYVLILFLFPILIFAQNDKIDLFEKLDRTEMQTSILFNHFLSFSEIADETKTSFDSNGFFQAYNELAVADSQNRFVEYQQLLDAKKESHFSKIIPIGIVYSEFDIISNDAINNNNVSFQENKFIKSPAAIGSIFELKHKLFAAPFRLNTSGMFATFSIANEFVLNTSGKQISSIKIDFW